MIHAFLSSFGRHAGSLAFLLAGIVAAGLYAQHLLRRLRRSLRRGGKT